MSDANRLKVAIVKESTWGTTPGSVTLKDLPYAVESLARNVSYTQSRLVRSDRQVVDTVLSNVSAIGDLTYELIYKGASGTAIVALDELMEAALFSATWTSPVTTTGSWASDSGASTITGTGVGTGVNKGDWIRWSSAVVGATPTYHIVTTAGANSLTVSPAPTTRAATASSEIEAGGYLKNGTTNTSFTIEKEFGGLTNIFANFLGSMIDRWSLDVGTTGPLGGTFGFVCKNETDATATLQNSGTELTPSTNRVFSSVSHVRSLLVGSALSSLQINEWGFDLRNNLRALSAVANLGAISIGTGSVNVTGKLNRYFDSNSEFSNFMSDIESQVALVCVDALGNAFVFHIPGVIYTGGRRVGGGINTDIRAELTWQARASTRYVTTAETMRVTRWDV